MGRGGRITVPVSIRRRLGLRPGDRFELIHSGEAIELMRVPTDPHVSQYGSSQVERLHDSLTEDAALFVAQGLPTFTRSAPKQRPGALPLRRLIHLDLALRQRGMADYVRVFAQG